MFKLISLHKITARYLSFIAALILFAPTVFALPQDGNVRSGDVQLNKINPKRLDVNQSTNKAIIDWHSFNIAEDEHAHFQMPSSDSLNLSRVTGGQRSDIFGKLSSNGRLMLINPNGVVFGRNSRVDVHGLVATTNNIRNQDFLANRFHFNIPGNPSARIVNRGTINIGNAGLLAFVAPGVENSGIINARLGRVGLASSNQFTLDLYGDNLITLGVEGKVLEKVYGEDGNPISSLVDQSGTINADGGQVYLQTNAARDIVDHAINVSGIIEAKTAIKKRGDIILNGGNEGKVKVSGRLNSSGLDSGQTGGTVHVLGDEVILEKARIFASGFNGGGTVLIGGDYQGKGSVINARNNYFDVDSQIYADATNNGNGGKVILWADERTDAFGKIYARGGAFGGDGGFVETSGKQTLAVTQAADVSAPFGKPGEWLLDPFDIEIVDSLSNAALTGGNKVDVAIINAALNNGTSVKIQSNNNGAGEGNILLTSAILKTSGGDSTLTLDAAGGITINNTITSTVGALTLDLMSATGVVINNALSLNGGSVTFNSNETFSRTNFATPGRQNIVQISHLSGAALPAAAHVSGTPGGLVHLSGNQNTTNTSAGHGTSITLSGVSVSTSGGSVTFQDGVTLTSGTVGINSSDGNITFNDTLKGTQNLTLSAGSGAVTFNGFVGGGELLTGLTLNASSAVFNDNAAFTGDVTITVDNGLEINGNWTNAASSKIVTIIADSGKDGSGSFTLGSSANFMGVGGTTLDIKAADVDIQGNLSASFIDFERNSVGSIGVGNATGNMTISGEEIGRITADTFHIRNGGDGDRIINVDGVQFSQTDQITNFRFGLTSTDGGNSSGVRTLNFLNAPSFFSSRKLLLITSRFFNDLNFNTSVSTLGRISATAENINITGNSIVKADVFPGDTRREVIKFLLGGKLTMSANSQIDSGAGNIVLSASNGMTLGLLKTTSSGQSSSEGDIAISLITGSGGVRDADLDGSLDIFVPNGTLKMNGEGGFGTFENPIEFNAGSLDIPSSQDFSSASVLANQTFTTTFGQSLQTITTSRTFRTTSESLSLASFSPVFNTGNNPITAISGYIPSLRPLVTNVFSQSFSLIETTTTTTSFTSTLLASGSSNIQFGNLLALDGLNSSLGTDLFSQVSRSDSGVQNISNFGLQSLVQTSTVSSLTLRTTLTRNSQFQSFGLGSPQFGGRIPIGTRSLGTVRTIGGGIATCLLSPSGSVRAVNVLADSNGGVNNQNNFTNVGLDFTSSNQNRNTSTTTPNTSQNTNTDNFGDDTSVGARISGRSTPTGNANISGSTTSVGARISGGETPNINANISGISTSVETRISGSSTPTENTTSAGNTNVTGSGFGVTTSPDSNADARISGGSTPTGNANISGSTTSVGARISGGETPNINANISGISTSVETRISGSDTQTINANISGNTTPSTNLNLGSRTNDRSLNNPDQFQENANAEQRSIDARISGNETPGQTRSDASTNSQNLDSQMREMRNRLVANTATERQNNQSNNTSEQTLQQRMSNLYSRIVGRNRTNSEDETDN